jgi:superfamily II DNA/RNA helicase
MAWQAMEGSGLHMVVATTGRLLDMLMTKHVRVGHVTMLVLDEADQLLTLGFSPQVHPDPHPNPLPISCSPSPQ